MSNDLFPDRLDNDDFLSLESLWQNLPPLTEIDLDEINEKENQNKSNPTSPLHSDSRTLLLPSIFPDSTEQEENIFLQKLEPLNVGESRNKQTNENLELQKKKETCGGLDDSNSENCIDEKYKTIEQQNKFTNLNILRKSQIVNKELNIGSSLQNIDFETFDLNMEKSLPNKKKKYNFGLTQNKKSDQNKNNLGKKKRNPRKIKQKKKKSKTIPKFLGITPLNRKRSHETSEMITFSNQFLNFSTFKNYFNERHTQKHLSSYSQPSSSDSDSDSNSNSDFYYDSDSNFNFDSNYLSNKHSKKHKPHFQFPKDYTNDTQNPDSNSDTDSSSFDELILYQFELAKKYQREREWKFSQNKNKIFK
ncbi:hypothetical protein M0813_17002 [Anaeramoeba flamelloides]|uniref:Uncharacterized protein n=1 Tax=Anaeramoeba flamelloides TaxID=1746091 RepID=A0ABQ8YYE2_9EUKA|nr:hypothetical protein M0813_17002 [Anaeramoeba flamelloides]